MKRQMLEAFSQAPTDRPAIWMMRQAGRYLPEYRAVRADAGDFMHLCLTPELACEVTLQPIRRYGFDAAIIFSDILLVPYAMGRNVWFAKGEGPQLNPLKAATDIDLLETADSETFTRKITPVYQALELTRKTLPAETALIGFAGAPWTLACYMTEGAGSKTFATARKWAYTAPEAFDDLLERLADAVAAHLCRQAEAGADVLQLFDSWAGLVPPALLKRAVIGPITRVARAVKAKHPHVPLIVFPRGVHPATLEALAKLNKPGQPRLIDALGLDETQDLAWATKHLAPHTTLQGNLDSAVLLGSPKQVAAATRTMLEMAPPQGYIANLGHGVLPETDPAAVAAFVETVKNYRRP